MIKLMEGDCLDLMSNIESGSVDAIITDPPYGTTACKWDSIIPLEPMWKQLKRIIKPNGAIVFNSAQPYTSVLVGSNLKDFKYDWTWRKPKGTGHLNAKKQPLRDKEDILIFYSKQCTYNPQMVSGDPFGKKTGSKQQSGVTREHGEFRNKNNGTRYPKQVLEFGVVERGNQHPTQKPVQLMEYLIKTYTNEQETVLDFTMGSGSTGVACKNLNRNFIGIEKDTQYFKIAQDRINSAV